MILRRPTLADQAAVLDMLREFEETGSAMDGGIWSEETLDYADWLEGNLLAEQGLHLPEGWVPAIQLVSFGEAGQALGFLHIRLRLNDYLMERGGHIGYSIRPSQRRKGYAKKQLRQGLAICASKAIQRVLITCDQTNEASRRTILASGGVLEDVRQGVERYWIDN